MHHLQMLHLLLIVLLHDEVGMTVHIIVSAAIGSRGPLGQRVVMMKMMVDGVNTVAGLKLSGMKLASLLT